MIQKLISIKCILDTQFKYFYHKHFCKSQKSKTRSTIHQYKKRFGYKLDLDNPTEFYELMNYLKLNYCNDLQSKYVDKLEAKNIVESHGYHNFAKTLKIFNSYKEFKKYILSISSGSFVIKTNHTSGDVYFYLENIFKRKDGKIVSRKYVLKKIHNALKRNYYYYDFETPYFDIKPKVFLEEYLPSLNNNGLYEYKFFCSYGKPVLINTVSGRQNTKILKEAFTNPELVPYNAKQSHEIFEANEIIKPSCFNEMKNFSSIFSKDFPLIRVDLLANDKEFYLCEFTFFDCSGMNRFIPEEANKEIGQLFDLKLNKKK